MKRLAIVPAILLVLFPAALAVLLHTSRNAVAAPAWGGNCLSCHVQFSPGPLEVLVPDEWADPDETATGAPDRGTLKVLHGYRGLVNRLEARVLGMGPDDTYAVQLKRLRFPGVVNGVPLEYFPDCDWPEWGDDVPGYYTDPAIAYRGADGPTDFAFEIEVYPWTDGDYFDLVLSVAGKFADDQALFYAEEHFYLRIVQPGDLNDNGGVELDDFELFEACLAGPDVTTPPPDCDPAAFALADLADDEDVDLTDAAVFQQVYLGY